MLKRYPQALMVFFFGTSLLTGCASTEEREVLTQNLSASNSLYANGGDMCPPGHTVFKYGNCYPRGTGCKPDYNWLEPNLCRKESCPDGYNKRVGSKCYQANNSLSWQTNCKGNYESVNGKKLCENCSNGYQECMTSFQVIQPTGRHNLKTPTVEELAREELKSASNQHFPGSGPYYLCCKCGTGTYHSPHTSSDTTEHGQVTPFNAGFCHTGPTSVQVVDEYSLQAASGPLKRNCSDLPVTVCGGAAFSHCVVRGEGDSRRCAWNIAPHYPRCEINGDTATCYDTE